jgi:site-specific DNA-methyltransferase (adenine-specific)
VVIETGPGWELRCSDCLDPENGLASLDAVDHVIADPPYSEHVHISARSSGRDSMIATAAVDRDGGRGASATRRQTDLGFTHLTEWLRRDISQLIAERVVRWSLVFCDAEGASAWQYELERFGLKHYCVGMWRRLNGAPRFTGLGPAQAFEAIEIACKKSGWNGGGKQAAWDHPVVINRGGQSPRLHPTQKPLALMESLIRDFTDPADLVCDPFAGSGTTGVAAIRLGRRFIGWEKDPEFFAVAVKRLRATREQMELLPRAVTKPKQGSLL